MEIVTSIDQLDLNKVYSYADYLKWNFEERVELIKGKIFRMSPAPSRKHQEISGNLFGILWTHLKNSNCKVFSAPFDVKLPVKSINDQDIYTVVQPDLCLICDETKLEDQGCIGAPDLIVEILSPATSKKDLKDKFKLYEESKVSTYWVIYPEEETLEVFELSKKGSYEFSGVYVDGESVSINKLGFEVEISELFSL